MSAAGTDNCRRVPAAAAQLVPGITVVERAGQPTHVTVAKADLSTSVPLILPEVKFTFRPNHWVETSGPGNGVWKASPKLVEHLLQSDRFRGVENLKLEPLGPG